MKSSTTNLDKSIETQIVSMLNGVMVEEDSIQCNENDITFKDKLPNKTDSDSFEDERETNCSSRMTFHKDLNNEYYLHGINSPFQFQDNQYDFIPNKEFTKGFTNKNYKTQNTNTYSYPIFNQSEFKSNNNFGCLNKQYMFPLAMNAIYMNNYMFNKQHLFPINVVNMNDNNDNDNKEDVHIKNNMNLYYNDNLRAQQYNMLFNSKMLFKYNNPQQLFFKSTFSPEEQIFSNYESDLLNECTFTYELYQKYKKDLIKLIKNQQTSRLSQVYIQNTPPEIIHLIYSEISSQINHLLLDPYANYFIIKLFFILDNSDKLNFLTQITKNITNLCINKISTYPIQCIIEHITTKQTQELIINSVKNHLMKITLDIYGTHVLEKVLDNYDYELIQPISKFIVDNFLFLANNANGLCIVKKAIVIEYKKNYFDKIKKLSEENALMLIQNPFGNYALQCLIDNWDIKDLDEILKNFIGKCSVLSIQKYSSNVIEKCIEKSPEFLKAFLNECTTNNYFGIGVLMQNSFGNYVIQTVLKELPANKDKENFIIGINQNLSKITDKKVLLKWKNILINTTHIDNQN
jgi:hypothetical protein